MIWTVLAMSIGIVAVACAALLYVVVRGADEIEL